jgi:uncharacterized protein YuzE
MMVPVRITYDPEADAVFIYLTEIPPGGAAASAVLDRYMDNASVIAVFNDANQLVGVEVLGASRGLPPDVLASAERP